ncbi:MAG TPA: Gfo/Idh/MocA family oxidoreductase, partial [Anaerolineae bacterium]|nr:Gfo/Idh/MocA family oxidoreductase [Anaerolineae bacterium]
CTPTGTHAQVAVGAAEAGKHLVVEKPLDVTLERADQIIAAARAAQVKFTTVFPYRFMAGSAAARRAVGAGRLGRLTLVEGRIAWYRSQEYYDGGGWRGTWHLDGGGALMNQSIHTIDLLQWLAGPVRSVYGRVATLTHRMETEDTAVAVLALKDGGLGVIEGATSCWPGEPARVTLRGERGTIALQEGRIVTWRLADSTAGEEESMLALEDSQGSGSADPAGISCEQHRRQIADMVDAIWDDRAPMVDGAEGRKVLEIILAIYRASQSGQPVEVS